MMTGIELHIHPRICELYQTLYLFEKLDTTSEIYTEVTLDLSLASAVIVMGTFFFAAYSDCCKTHRV